MVALSCVQKCHPKLKEKRKLVTETDDDKKTLTNQVMEVFCF
jgi:hypothetical protein